MNINKHTITIIVPEEHLDIANNVALLIGQSVFDINTFDSTEWIDKDLNNYAICSTLIEPEILELINNDLIESNTPLHAKEIIDINKVNEALSKIVLYTEDMIISKDNITIIIDYEPLPTIELLGISRK